MKTIIEFVTEQRPELKKVILITFSCPSSYGHGYGYVYAWGRPTYCNGGRPRNGEKVCLKCWGRPIEDFESKN